MKQHHAGNGLQYRGNPRKGIMHLTYRTETPHPETPSVSAEGVGAPEIEITAEMLAAGADVLAEHYMGDGIYDTRPEVLAKIYLAMSAAR